jgi:hypothetical protein
MYQCLSPYAYVGNSPNYLIEKDGHLIGTIIGAVVGGYRAAKEGKSVWAGAAKGAVSGAVADLTAAAIIVTGGTATPILMLAGAAAGFTGNLTDQVLDDRPGVNKGELALSTLVGGGLGYLGSKLSGPISRGFSKLFGRSKGKVSVGPVISVKLSDDLNNVFYKTRLLEGKNAEDIILPWKPGTVVQEFTTIDKTKGFIRFVGSGNDGKKGNWIMRIEDVTDAKGKMLSFDEIQNKYAIPNKLTGYQEIKLDKGVKLRFGEANSSKAHKGGGTQYEIVGGQEKVTYGKTK